MEDKKLIYFQYQKNLNLPIYVAFDSDQFGQDMIGFLTRMRFQELSEKEGKLAAKRIEEEDFGRVLKIEEASPVVAKQIEQLQEGDYHGDESVSKGGHGCRIYRYKGVAIMAYSLQVSEWHLGCFRDFGSEGAVSVYRTVINRFLSYALAPLGITGVWGIKAGKDIAILKQSESRGEAVFVEVKRRNIISVDGVSKMSSHFKIVRSQGNMAAKEGKMTREELLSCLFAHATYLDHEGLSVPVRQILHALSKLAQGMYCREETLRQRLGLAL